MNPEETPHPGAAKPAIVLRRLSFADLFFSQIEQRTPHS